MSIRGIHFDSMIFDNAAKDIAVRRILCEVKTGATESGLQCAYSPMVLVESLSGIKPGREETLVKAKSRLRLLRDICGDQALPSPEIVIERLFADGDPVEDETAALAEAVNTVLQAESLAAVEGAVDLQAAHDMKERSRRTFVDGLKKTQSYILAQHERQDEQLAFIESDGFVRIVYAGLAIRADQTPSMEAADTTMRRVDAFLCGYREIMRNLIVHPEYNPEKHSHDTEDLHLLLHASEGYAFVTSERKILDWTAASRQSGMVWRLSETLEQLKSL